MTEFYERLPAVLRQPAVRDGQWQLLEDKPDGAGQGTSDAFIAFGWEGRRAGRLVLAVKHARHASQGFVRLPFSDPGGRRWWPRDLLGAAAYERDGNDLQVRGLYLEMVPWQNHGFALDANLTVRE